MTRTETPTRPIPVETMRALIYGGPGSDPDASDGDGGPEEPGAVPEAPASEEETEPMCPACLRHEDDCRCVMIW